MKSARLVLAIVAFGSVAAAEGPYLGQSAPGHLPELFAPGIVSGPFDERMLVATDGGNRLMYQLRGVPVSVIVEMVDRGDDAGRLRSRARRQRG